MKQLQKSDTKIWNNGILLICKWQRFSRKCSATAFTFINKKTGGKK